MNIKKLIGMTLNSPRLKILELTEGVLIDVYTIVKFWLLEKESAPKNGIHRYIFDSPRFTTSALDPYLSLPADVVAELGESVMGKLTVIFRKGVEVARQNQLCHTDYLTAYLRFKLEIIEPKQRFTGFTTHRDGHQFTIVVPLGTENLSATPTQFFDDASRSLGTVGLPGEIAVFDGDLLHNGSAADLENPRVEGFRLVLAFFVCKPNEELHAHII
ncbi:MAG: hypothetical protein EXS67_06150 [Candidatus Margulisbacteria bacterium]|nr:hypothetical protein [Candidatus Margulisiibacteriota bacterium]